MKSGKRMTGWKSSGKLTFALLMWLGAVSCGGSVETDAPPVPLSQWQSELAAELCNAYSTCCQQAGFSNDYGKCVTTFAPRVTAGITLDPARYDPKLARRCIDTVVGLASSCLLGDLWPTAATDVCGPLYGGASSITEKMGAIAEPTGGACDATCARWECIGQSTTQQPPPKPARVCLLAQGLSCGPDQRCGSAKLEGEPCRGILECANEASCIDGRCVEPQRTGPCADSRFCADASRCIDGQCVPTVVSTREFCAGDY